MGNFIEDANKRFEANNAWVRMLSQKSNSPVRNDFIEASQAFDVQVEVVPLGYMTSEEICENCTQYFESYRGAVVPIGVYFGPVRMHGINVGQRGDTTVTLPRARRRVGIIGYDEERGELVMAPVGDPQLAQELVRHGQAVECPEQIWVFDQASIRMVHEKMTKPDGFAQMLLGLK